MNLLTRDEINRVSGGDAAAAFVLFGPLAPFALSQWFLQSLSLSSGVGAGTTCTQVAAAKEDKSGGS